MGDFSADTAVAGESGQYAAELSPDWDAWGPNGGYLAAILLRTAAAHGIHPRPASMTCHFLAVAGPGPVALRAETMRSARNAESIRVTMTQGDRRITEGLIWLVADGLDGIAHEAAVMPDVPDPDGLRPVEELLDGDTEGAPAFWLNFDSRPTMWHDDWMNRPAGEPRWHSWYRHRSPRFADPVTAAGSLLPLLDIMAWSAAIQPHPATPYMAPNLDLSVQFHRDARETEWLFAEGASDVAGSGLAGFTSRIWSRSRTLLASASGQLLCRPAPTK